MIDATDEAGTASRSIPREKIEDSQLYREFLVKEPRWRERTASRIAYMIVILFGVCLLISFFFAFYVLHRPPANAADDKIVDLSMSYLKTVGGIFTPVLAFIMGYYFSRKED